MRRIQKMEKKGKEEEEDGIEISSFFLSFFLSFSLSLSVGRYFESVIYDEKGEEEEEEEQKNSKKKS